MIIERQIFVIAGIIRYQVGSHAKKPARGGLETGMDSCLRRNDGEGRNAGK